MLEHEMGSKLRETMGNYLSGVHGPIECWAKLDPSIDSLVDVLDHPDPPLDVLVSMKDYAKAMHADPSCEIPDAVPNVIYFVAIALGRVRCRQSITQLEHDVVRSGLSWVSGEEWIPLQLRHICQEALSQDQWD